MNEITQARLKASPLSEVIQLLEYSIFYVAPERKEEMEILRHEYIRSIEIDPGQKAFVFGALNTQKEIYLSLPATERLWAYTYGFSMWLACSNPPELGVVPISSGWSIEKALKCIYWAQRIDIDDQEQIWPSFIPALTSGKRGTMEYGPTKIFFKMYGWLLLHELAHLVCNHKSYHELSTDESIRQELAADDWACSWIFTRWREQRDHSHVYAWRAQGVAYGILVLCGFEVYKRTSGASTHPNPIERMRRFLKKYVQKEPADTARDGAGSVIWLVKRIFGFLLASKKINVSMSLYFDASLDEFLDNVTLLLDQKKLKKM